MKFGTDGVRGVANTDLTASFALDLGRAAARVLGRPQPNAVEAVVGGDTRVSTAMLEAAFVAGMAAEGVVVHRLGVVPTPTVAFEANRRNAVGAVISASHNPYHDNGIKLFARGGTKLADEIEERIEREVLSLPPPTGEPAQLLDAEESPDYLAHLVDALDGRSLSGLRIVVDCANGAASVVAPRVFTTAGADVVDIHDKPNGRNINDRCGATHLDSLSARRRGRGRRPRARPRRRRRSIARRRSHRPGRRRRLHHGDLCDRPASPRRPPRSHDRRHGDVESRLPPRHATARAFESSRRRSVTATSSRRSIEGGYTMGGEQSGHVIFRDRAHDRRRAAHRRRSSPTS